ncbi:hypothetical protein C8Q74DRAFT_1197848 [Fomes fomentarius]|nr:hypothetical protein C8Q74DRAFT_1197848 [Fomes fomentarius]
MKFSTMTLSGTPILQPITLAREEAFPARHFDIITDERRYRPDWTPAPLPKGGAHLCLELGERISGGRSAVVYAARIVRKAPEGSARSRSSVPLPDKRELCVKIARPNHCRTLAREAWFYEQFAQAKFHGVITPRCYGFFALQFPDASDLFPHALWANDSKHNYEDDSDDDREDDDSNDDDEDNFTPAPDDPTRDDHLPDDPEPDDDDTSGSECDISADPSPWNDWRPTLNSPLLAVLVLVRGSHIYRGEDDRNRDTQNEIREILHDLSRMYIIHVDIRPPNLVRAPANTRRCRFHKRIHNWNIIDFGWAAADDPQDDKDGVKQKTIATLHRHSYQSEYFYTGKH